MPKSVDPRTARSASTTCAMSDAPHEWQRVDGPLSFARRGSGPRMVFVHGFTQSGRSWLPIAELFTDDHEVVLIDAPGHGHSGNIRANLAHGADLLAATTGCAHYVGYSMGGRLCLHLALAYPELVRSLTLVGATAGIINHTERSTRLTADEALAVELEEGGVEAFVTKWLAQSLFATLPAAAAGLDDRLQNTTAGLASSLRMAGTGTQASLWSRVSEISVPTLVLAGAGDHKFSAIGHDLAAAIGNNARFESIVGAGHAAHLEQPNAVAVALREFVEGFSG